MLMIESISSAAESKNSISSADQFLNCLWSTISLNDKCDSVLALLDCWLFKTCDINLIKSTNWAKKNSLKFSDWLALKLSWSDMLTCLFCFTKLIDDSLFNESSLICRSTRFEKDFSNRLIAFLKSDLFVTHFSDQERESSDASEIVRIRSTSVDVDDLIWCNVISTSLLFVENDIKKTYWWSLSINFINSKIKYMRFLLTVRLLDWLF